VQLDTKKQILAALNIKNVEDADAEYQKYVKGDMLMNVDGTLTENTGEFATNYEKEAKEQQRLHVFVCEVDGQTKYVVPVYGAGLWGAIWGYIALNEDKDTVYGTYFSHARETPGLGAEIATEHFQNEFVGKKTLEDGSIALGVVKNGKVEKPEYQVDGISGGTITSVGVDAMLKACLSSYMSFLTK
jgi:Na+-transporting NADH:ubiquinone oxidoreductase subunit C